MHRRVTARTPAATLPQPGRMGYVADINLTRRPLDLRMAFQAKIQIALNQQLSIHRTMRIMANRAALAHSLMFEHKGPGLFAMTLRAVFVEPCHRQTARRARLGCDGRLENVAPMRIMALHAIHLPLDHRMMLRHSKFCFRLQMALET